jgi:hypothetical protein
MSEVHRFVDDAFERYDDEYEEKTTLQDLDISEDEARLATAVGQRAFDEAKRAGASDREASLAKVRALDEVYGRHRRS